MLLAREGHDSVAAGDHNMAVIAFRKCAFLAPDDTMAHLHLGLALEAAGDRRAAGRAFATARRALLAANAPAPEHAIEGYASTELLKLLDAKRKAFTGW
jgi:chemotaxis protein methyltransferase CheR